MKYMLLIYDEEKKFDAMPQTDVQKMIEAYGKFTEKVKQSGQLQSSGRLQATTNATTVRLRDGKRLVTDGPFAETREQLGGYYLVDAKNLDEAIELAAQIPSARAGSIEVRPLFEMARPATT
jgi:hypothetical protein